MDIMLTHSSFLCLNSLLDCTTVSAGFATVHGNNTLTINAVEAYEMDQFSPEVSGIVFAV